ncbi:MAG: hypothetical protein WC073_13180 [Sterolibacterium sp.]
MLSRPYFVLALMTLLLPIQGFCQSGAQWSGSAESQSKRTQVDGMKTYYEPDGVKKSGSVVTFKMYSSADPTVKEGDDYSINCSTQEIAFKQGTAAWTPPFRVLAGEQLYPIAKKLCDWGPGFWQKLMD